MTRFLRWLTHTHTQALARTLSSRRHGTRLSGTIQVVSGAEGQPLFHLLRYVERNALRAKLVQRAEDWRWSSLYHRQQGSDDALCRLLYTGPLLLPADWVELVNEPQTEAELESLRQCVNRGQPYGSEDWRADGEKVELGAYFSQAGQAEEENGKGGISREPTSTVLS